MALSEGKLARFVLLLAAMDYVSTYAFIRLSSNDHVTEGGPIAGWALQTGGFLRLFLVDSAVVLSLTTDSCSLMACTVDLPVFLHLSG
jgi:hypothetical protein